MIGASTCVMISCRTAGRHRSHRAGSGCSTIGHRASRRQHGTTIRRRCAAGTGRAGAHAGPRSRSVLISMRSMSSGSVRAATIAGASADGRARSGITARRSPSGFPDRHHSATAASRARAPPVRLFAPGLFENRAQCLDVGEALQILRDAAPGVLNLEQRTLELPLQRIG